MLSAVGGEKELPGVHNGRYIHDGVLLSNECVEEFEQRKRRVFGEIGPSSAYGRTWNSRIMQWLGRILP